MYQCIYLPIHRKLPSWYKCALFNELYYIADGGTVWLYEVNEEIKSGVKVAVCDSDDQWQSDNMGKFGYLEGSYSDICIYFSIYLTTYLSNYLSLCVLSICSIYLCIHPTTPPRSQVPHVQHIQYNH